MEELAQSQGVVSRWIFPNQDCGPHHPWLLAFAWANATSESHFCGHEGKAPGSPSQTHRWPDHCSLPRSYLPGTTTKKTSPPYIGNEQKEQMVEALVENDASIKMHQLPSHCSLLRSLSPLIREMWVCGGGGVG